MIEQRWFPLGAVVTVGACGDTILCELLAMRVFVTLFAFRWRRAEVSFAQLGLKICRLVAVDASRRAVRSQQPEGSRIVIKRFQVLP